MLVTAGFVSALVTVSFVSRPAGTDEAVFSVSLVVVCGDSVRAAGSSVASTSFSDRDGAISSSTRARGALATGISPPPRRLPNQNATVPTAMRTPAASSHVALRLPADGCDTGGGAGTLSDRAGCAPLVEASADRLDGFSVLTICWAETQCPLAPLRTSSVALSRPLMTNVRNSCGDMGPNSPHDPRQYQSPLIVPSSVCPAIARPRPPKVFRTPVVAYYAAKKNKGCPGRLKFCKHPG